MERAEGGLEDPSATVHDGPPPVPDESPLPLRVGRFFIFRRLGLGGMGEVLLGYDEALSRKLAIKLWRDRGDPTDLRTRMRREAQALARLSHPSVVQVYEVGDHRGQLYLAMEYVEGQTLREWAKGGPPIAAIVERYVQAGRGLAAAHHAGILHRDFKPDNAVVGADGRVRVLDFGLARADANLADPDHPRGRAEADAPRLPVTTFDSLDVPITQAGSLLGTPAYMPPEQLAGKPTDARADIYSFCASLWEALHSVRPYAGATPPDLLTAILAQHPREGDGRSIPGWLRAVLVRGLAPAASDRWPSMDALVRALEEGASRRRRRVAGVLAIALVALVALAVALVRADRSQRESACDARGAAIAAEWSDDARARVRAALLASGKPHAARTADRVDALLDEYAKTWSQEQVESCRRATLDRTWDADHAARADACLDERRWSLAGLVGVLAEADPGAATRAIEAAAALPPLAPCLDVDTLARSPSLPTDPEVRARATAVQIDLARALSLGAAGRYADGLALAERLVEPADALGWPPLAAQVRYAVGNLAAALRRADRQAERVLEGAFFLALDAGHDALAVRAASRLAEVVGAGLLRLDDAERWSRLAHAILPRSAGEAPLLRANLLCVDANLVKLRGDSLAAAEAYERCYDERAAVLGPEHPLTAAALVSHASVASGVADHARVRDLLERALAAQEPALGPEHPMVAKTLGELGAVLVDLGELDRAEAVLTRALELDRRNFGDDHARVGDDHLRIARLQHARGRLDEARRHYRDALARFEAGPPNARAMSVEALSELADVEREAGDLDAALALAERAHQLFAGHVGADHAGLAPGLVDLAALRIARGEPELAAPLIERARRMMSAGESPDLIRAYMILADLARGAGDPGQALTDLDRALALARAAPGGDHGGLGLILLRRGELRLERGDLEGALTDLEDARQRLERPGPAAPRGAARFALARALAARGEEARARELAARALAPDGGLEGDARADVQRWLDALR